jgi:hypothetical protein
MARGHARQDRAGQRLLAHDELPGRRDGQRARGGDAERCRRLADEVFAQHRTEGGASVAAARERRASGTLELDVASSPVRADDLAEKDRPPVAELRDEPAELMAGIRERERLRACRNIVADENRCARG